MDWTEYAEVYAAEKAAYVAYRDAQTPPEHQRVRTRVVQVTQRAWYDALDARYAIEERIAAELGVKRFEVPMLFLAETTTPKEVKR